VVRKTTSLKIDEDLWKEVKIHCIKQGCDISDFIEGIIKKTVKGGKG